jgi:predicted kinase
MATLHFIGGKAGAGKTTLARELGESERAIVICEDEWLSKFGFVIRSLDDYRDATGRFRDVIRPLVIDLLRLNVSVVLDYPANTVQRRAWMRALFDSAGADHVLHWIEASDSECLDNIHRRNEEKPTGIYWGEVSDQQFNAVNPYVIPPSPDEGFNIVEYTVYSRRG